MEDVGTDEEEEGEEVGSFLATSQTLLRSKCTTLIETYKSVDMVITNWIFLYHHSNCLLVGRLILAQKKHMTRPN